MRRRISTPTTVSTSRLHEGAHDLTDEGSDVVAHFLFHIFHLWSIMALAA